MEGLKGYVCDRFVGSGTRWSGNTGEYSGVNGEYGITQLLGVGDAIQRGIGKLVHINPGKTPFGKGLRLDEADLFFSAFDLADIQAEGADCQNHGYNDDDKDSNKNDPALIIFQAFEHFDPLSFVLFCLIHLDVTLTFGAYQNVIFLAVSATSFPFFPCPGR